MCAKQVRPFAIAAHWRVAANGRTNISTPATLPTNQNILFNIKYSFLMQKFVYKYIYDSLYTINIITCIEGHLLYCFFQKGWTQDCLNAKIFCIYLIYYHTWLYSWFYFSGRWIFIVFFLVYCKQSFYFISTKQKITVQFNHCMHFTNNWSFRKMSFM